MTTSENQSGSLFDSTLRNWVRLNSVVVFGISFLVIIGWFIGNRTLTQINPTWASMKFNNALCLALEAIAIGVGTLNFGPIQRIRLGAACLILVVAVATLIEFGFGITGGIDQLFIQDVVLVKTSSPGRMSIITALCHLLIGLTLVFEFPRVPKWILRVKAFLPGIVLAIGASGLLGYIFGIEQAYGWGQLTRMAFHTAFCFFLLSLGIIFTPEKETEFPERKPWRLAPFLAGGWILIALVTIALVMHTEQSVSTQVIQEGSWIRSIAENGLGNTEHALNRLQLRELENSKNGQNTDQMDVKNYLKDFPEILWITVQSTRFYREGEGELNSEIPHEAVYKKKLADFGFGLDLRAFFLIIPEFQDKKSLIRFTNQKSLIEPSKNTETIFPFANKQAILDLTGAADIRNTMNKRTYFVITITSLFLAGFTWFALKMSAKAEAKANEIFAAHKKLDVFTKELERSNADLEQFVLIASHDLQTPLRHISGFVKLLLENPEIHKDTQSREYGRYISDAVDRMQKLIAGVLDISRIERVPQAIQSINLGDLLARNIRNLEPDLDAVGGIVTVEPGLPTIKGNAIRLSQLFENLLLNSIKYRDKSRPLQVRISMRQLSRSWVLSLEDNGLGIKPEYREKVFQMFQRLHNQSEIKGTGIGLTLCRRIVEQHSGKISLENSSLGGVTLAIELPNEMVQSNLNNNLRTEELHAV